MAEWTPPATRYHCLISSCPWTAEYPGPDFTGDGTSERVLPGEVAGKISGLVNAVLRAHLETHPLEQWAAEVGTLRERLAAAEEVCLVFGWTGAHFESDRDKALHELWRHWCEVSGASLSPSAHPELGDDRIAELARKRDETRARTLAAIRDREGVAE